MLVIHRLKELDCLNPYLRFGLRCGPEDMRERTLMNQGPGPDPHWMEIDEGGGSVIDQAYIDENGPLLVWVL